MGAGKVGADQAKPNHGKRVSMKTSADRAEDWDLRGRERGVRGRWDTELLPRK